MSGPLNLQINWGNLAQDLLEHLPSPAAVLDRDHALQLANEKLARLLGTPAATLRNRPLPAALGSQGATDCPLDCVFGDSGRYCECHVTCGQEAWAWLTIERSPLRAGEGAEELVQVTSSRTAPATEAPPVFVDFSYEIRTDGSRFGELLLPVTSTPGVCARRLHEVSAQGLCHQVVHGRATACAGCPAAVLSRAHPAAHAVIPFADSPESDAHVWYMLTIAELSGEHSARIGARLLGDDLLSELLRARVSALAARAGLSQRERELLDLLLLGRSLDEAALVMKISPRTVKFHQGNLLSKLQADSRIDLFRLLF